MATQVNVCRASQSSSMNAIEQCEIAEGNVASISHGTTEKKRKEEKRIGS